MKPLWKPSLESINSSNMKLFIDAVNSKFQENIIDYQELWRWSVDNTSEFWDMVWDFCGVEGEKKGEVFESDPTFYKSQFFPESSLNFAKNLLKNQSNDPAIIFWGEDKVRRELSFKELNEEVAKIYHYLKSLGVKTGDRVAGYVPNTPEAVIAMLATSALGAIWTSCSPDFGVSGVLDRFSQVKPKVLFTADGYYYNGKTFNCLEKVQEISNGMPTLNKVIVFNYAGSDVPISSVNNAISWDDIGDSDTPIDFEEFPFNHPLFIMYSSGTTGVPKCIVHGAGGVLLQHLKEHQLHCDIKRGDLLFYFTTCGWMMWNWMVTGLASGATLMLYDGSPFHRKGNILFDMAEREVITHFGTSAKYIDALEKAGLSPNSTHNLSKIRMIASTGSPLLPESFDYVYKNISSNVNLASISGGTDIVSCFVLGNPISPVWRGEIQGPGLGMSIDVWDENGKPTNDKGELVCTKPFPVMPLRFWNDEENTKYRASYFEKYPGIWHHGDFMQKTEHGGYVIYGRSDATLNPGGVRIGTAEIYRQVESFNEVMESLVVGQDWEGDVRVVLFVKMRENHELSSDLEDAIRKQIRANTTPRHVPAKIIAVPDIPRTKSGKIVELAVRDLIHGREVKNREALANPDSLDFYKTLALVK